MANITWNDLPLRRKAEAPRYEVKVKAWRYMSLVTPANNGVTIWIHFDDKRHAAVFLNRLEAKALRTALDAAISANEVDDE